MAAAFYIQRDYKPAWSRNRLEEFSAALDDLRFDGLSPDSYGATQWLTLHGQVPEDDPEARAKFDLRVTGAYLEAIGDLHDGRLDPRERPRGNAQRVKGAPALPESDEPPDLQAAAAAADNGNFARAFEKARPQHPMYDTLRDELKNLITRAEQGGWATVPAGPTLEPGVSDPRVVLLRRRLAAQEYLSGDSESDVYDETVVSAVEQFQADHGLAANGTVDPATRLALNVPIEKRVDQLRVNLERLRWQRPQLQGDFVVVDVTGYEVRYYRDGESVWKSRVQVGARDTPTPALSSNITHVTLNPMWGVPPGMMQREILPKIQDNENYLRRMRLRVLNERGDEIDPDDVDWDEPYGIILRQDAGPNGALGRAAIRFPSPYAVYLHETPYKKLFDRDQRAFSNGCIRVEDQIELVRMLMGWDEATMQAELAEEKTRDVQLPQPLPIMLVYWTAEVNPGGRVVYKNDVYGLDAPTLRLLDQRGAAQRIAAGT
jgi:murein L,D-transpeptidase YcbB/YkuD